MTRWYNFDSKSYIIGIVRILIGIYLKATNYVYMTRVAVLLLLALANTYSLFAQHQVFDPNKLILSPFDYNEVKLQASPLKSQFGEVESYYLAISNDDLLKGFRERAGLPTNGAKDLGGWYSNDVFHIFGQLLGGMSRLYAVSGNQAMKTKVATLVNEWAKTIDKDGYFYYSNKPNAKHYVYEKMVGGLVDAYLFTGNKQALEELNVITDWAIKNLSRDRVYGHTKTEWYTLSENLYRAYEVTKNKKYLDFGKVWEYTDYWNTYLQAGPPVGQQKHHAYSHLNTLSGAAAAYFVSGEEKYKSIVKNAYDYFQTQQCFATGGYGPNERLLPKDKLIEALENTHNTFETQCGSWAIFKLSKYLLEMTGDAKYGDWMEKMTFNGIGANIPMSADGKVQYYSDYNPREGTKHNHHAGWSCCTGTRPQAVAEYAGLIYFKGKDGLYVNLYTPSGTEWNGMAISQVTAYPESNQTELTVGAHASGKKAILAFRNPSWAKKPLKIYVNGTMVNPVKESNWLKVERVWKNRDKVKIVFPLELSVDRLDDTKPYPAALLYGPVAMAVNITREYPASLVKEEDLSSRFIPVKSKPLHFKVKGHPDLVLRPYYQFAPLEPYVLYVDPVNSKYVLSRDLEFKGNWQKGRGPYFTKDKNASVSTSFTGKGISVQYGKYNNAGMMKVEIDGKTVDMLDTYAATTEAEFGLDKTYAGLTDGKHTITISPAGKKNPESKDTVINFYRFKIRD